MINTTRYEFKKKNNHILYTENERGKNIVNPSVF